MTNREYTKQKIKEYCSKKVDEAGDQELWNNILFTIQEDEEIGDREISWLNFLFDCQICKKIFGPCLIDVLSCSEFDASDESCERRFRRYMEKEHIGET